MNKRTPDLASPSSALPSMALPLAWLLAIAGAVGAVLLLLGAPGYAVLRIAAIVLLIIGSGVILRLRHDLVVALTANRRQARAYEERLKQAARERGELVESRDAAAAAAEARTRFLSHMTHEIRTPLNGVFGMTDLLLRGDLNEKQHHQVRTIRRSCDSLLVIVNDVLDLAKIEAGALSLEERAFDLSELIDGILGPFESEAARRRLELRTEVEDALPRGVVADSTRLGQVLNNLVANALKFTQQGSVTLAVRREGEAVESDLGREEIELLFEVRDTGVGIPESNRDRLFQAFSQAGMSTAREYGGTGLGLAISRLLVEQMGGRIWFESEEGRGTTFFFTIHVPMVELTAEAASPEVFTLPRDLARDFPQAILVAEDDAVNRKVMADSLEAMGYAPRFATDGAQALTALGERTYDLLLLDLHMPEVDGFEVAKQLKESPPNGARPRVIALTASADREVRERCVRLGVDGYLTKPMQLERLVAVLRGEDLFDLDLDLAPSSEAKPMPTVEVKALEDLRELGARADRDLVPELVESFQRVTPERLERLRTAMREGQVKAVQEIAHQLRGTAANLGARKLAHVCRLVEEAASAGDLAAAVALQERLDQVARHTLETLGDTVAPAPIALSA